MQRRTIVIALAAIAAIGLWYAFRPERLFIDRTVNESLEAAMAATAPAATAEPSRPTARSIAVGRFHSNAHATRGTATVYEIGGGRRILRLTDFETSNGPDVHVYLVAASDVMDDATVSRAGFVELGSIKGNRGDQNYELPASVDLARYRTVTIWCRRFSVNFGSAPLGTAGS
ncbi:MAG TPA: DM13 domain-containing protein [Gemmatimonadaceae bacterium]|nr:DM13 domain-containing protein [Gemmatimonadaceae bacterium]